MELRIEVSDELASRIEPVRDQLPKVLEMGLRELTAVPDTGFGGLAQVLETLAGLPAPEEVLELRPSPELQARISELLERSREGALSDSEAEEWERYQYLEHLLRLAKAKATQRLQAA